MQRILAINPIGKRIFILGGGISGLSTAYLLKKRGIRSRIFEKEDAPGGLCRSIKQDGFTFDYSGHLLHFRRRDTFRLVKGLLKDNLTEHSRNAYVHTFHKYIPYPFQTNIHHLPRKIAQECRRGFIDTLKKQDNYSGNGNFLNWINAKFGSGIAKHFMVPYNEKFWKTPLDTLIHEGIERFIVTPTPEAVISGGLKDTTGRSGYHASFWYPKKGGIQELINSLARGLDCICCNHEVCQIDLDKKTLLFTNGAKEKFDILLSTLPLPEIGTMIRGIPGAILRSFKKLRWVSVYNLNLGVKKTIKPGWHWIYFPQKKYPFFRVGFFHNFCQDSAPPQKGALYIDISYSKERPLNKRAIDIRIVKDLIRAGILASGDDIDLLAANDIQYAYPLYDSKWKAARLDIMNYLNAHNIFSLGRFGSWSYMSMEDVFLQSQSVCEALCKRS